MRYTFSPIKTLKAALAGTSLFAAVALFAAGPAYAQSGTTLTSGMGGGASSTARLQAQVTRLQARLSAVEACGADGYLFGGNNFTGATTTEDCIQNLQVNESNDIVFAPVGLRVGSGAPTATLGVGGNASVSGDVNANNVTATSTVSATTVDASGDVTADGNVVAASRLRVGSAGTPSTQLDVNGSGDISGALTVGGNAQAARLGAGVAPGHPLHVSGNGFITGNVGIGAAPTSNRLHVNGRGQFTDRVNSNVGFYHTSDRSRKDNIQPMENVLEQVRKLQAVTYTMKGSDEKQAGFIAQDVDVVFPEVVSSNEDGIRSIDYSKLVAHITAAMQEQDSRIDQQDQRIEQLEAELRALKELISNAE